MTDHDGDDGETGNDPLDQAEWEFMSKGGYDGFEDYVDEDAWEAARVEAQRILGKLMESASPQEKHALRAALARLKAGKPLSWEEVARGLGKSSGAVKTQVRRAADKFNRRKD